jgi:hypothetical protein
LTITPVGAIAPLALGVAGVYATIGAGYVLNQGAVTGGMGQTGSLATVGGTGGPGVYLAAGSVTNDGLLEGGVGGRGGAGVVIGGDTLLGGGYGGRGGAGAAIAGGTLQNNATIIGGVGGGGGDAVLGIGEASPGRGGNGGYGVLLIAGSLANAGTITGGRGGGNGRADHMTSHVGGAPGVFVVAGSLTNTGIIIGGGSYLWNPNGGQPGPGVFSNHGGTLTNAGIISYGTGGFGAGYDAVLFRGGPARVIVEPGATFHGGVVANASFSNVLELAANSTVQALPGVIGYEYQGFGTITFDPGASWLIGVGTGYLAAGPTIVGFNAGDTVELRGFVETGYSYASGHLILSGTAGATATIGMQGTFATSDFSLSTAAGNTFVELSPACFAAGTRIATDRGEVAVEALAVGDKVRVLLANTPAPVIWIGHRHNDCRRHPDPRCIWPVRISKGAFGAVPRRDLMLSPDHALYVEDVLIPVKYLVNGTTIVQVPMDEVTYYHIELPQHNVLLADGLPAESYLDVGGRSDFANGGGVIHMHPNFALDEACEAMWEAAGCAPLRIAGEQFDRVVADLRNRAALPGQASAHKLRRRSGSRSEKATDPGRLLNPIWYLANNPDVAAAGVDAAVHYVNWGRQEGRLPCNEIDLVRALGLVDHNTRVFTMADVIDAGVDPVAHFCTIGWRERRRPNPYFDTGWYLDTNDVPADMNPLLHYVLLGEARGLRPSRHFDPAWYRQRYAIGRTDSPLAHYLKHRRTRHFSPIPTFDVAAYVQAHATTLRPYRDPYAHFRAIGRSIPTRNDQVRDIAA